WLGYWRLMGLTALIALSAIAAEPAAPITGDYPLDGSIFPPDFAPPTFLFRDSSAGAKFWKIEVSLGDAGVAIQTSTKGQRTRMGEIDQRRVASNNELPKLTPQEAASWIWKPDPSTWPAIKKRSVGHPAKVAITGFADEMSKQPLSRGAVTLHASRDPVG